MCRYAVPYKTHYACFRCRKTYKRRLLGDYSRPPLKGEEREALCPQCREPMKDLGPDFKSPTQDDLKQWRKVELLFEHGITFHSCGCCGPGARPGKLNEVEEFLIQRKRDAAEQKRLQAVAERAAKLKTKRKKAREARFAKVKD